MQFRQKISKITKPLSHFLIPWIFTDRPIDVAKEKTFCILEHLNHCIINIAKRLAAEKKSHAKQAKYSQNQIAVNRVFSDFIELQ